MSRIVIKTRKEKKSYCGVRHNPPVKKTTDYKIVKTIKKPVPPVEDEKVNNYKIVKTKRKTKKKGVAVAPVE